MMPAAFLASCRGASDELEQLTGALDAERDCPQPSAPDMAAVRLRRLELLRERARARK